MLRQLDLESDERLIVGPGGFDDAGVVRLDDSQAVVVTTDFFPPVVDDPRAYGEIAAANALSDVYAMGGRPVACLNIAGFPDDFEVEWQAEIYAGGAAKVREAGAVLAGGHTLTAPEPIYGLAVTGLVDPGAVTTNGGGRPGDHLYLTKPLGSGVITTAGRKEKAPAAVMEAAVASMATLNEAAAKAAERAGVRGATDVTGFGLMGHAREMAEGSGAAIEFDATALPLLGGALALAGDGWFSGRRARAEMEFEGLIEIGDGVDPMIAGIAMDAETSGGLLLAVREGKEDVFEGACEELGVTAVRVGRMVEPGGPLLRLV